MFCIKCGAVMNDEADFCAKCGYAAGDAEVTRVAGPLNVNTAARMQLFEPAGHPEEVHIFSIRPTALFINIGYVLAIVAGIVLVIMPETLARVCGPRMTTQARPFSGDHQFPLCLGGRNETVERLAPCAANPVDEWRTRVAFLEREDLFDCPHRSRAETRGNNPASAGSEGLATRTCNQGIHLPRRFRRESDYLFTHGSRSRSLRVRDALACYQGRLRIGPAALR